MDRSPAVVAVVAAGAVSLAASLFAIGAAASSDDESTAEPPAASVESEPSASPAPDSAAPADSEAPADSGAAAATAGETVAIDIAGFQFGDGQPVTVAVGTEVVWTNKDSMDHSVEFDDTAIEPSPELAQGDTFSFTFTEPGTYDYICGIHPRMRGTIVVEG